MHRCYILFSIFATSLGVQEGDLVEADIVQGLQRNHQLRRSGGVHLHHVGVDECLRREAVLVVDIEDGRGTRRNDRPHSI